MELDFGAAAALNERKDAGDKLSLPLGVAQHRLGSIRPVDAGKRPSFQVGENPPPVGRCEAAGIRRWQLSAGIRAAPCVQLFSIRRRKGRPFGVNHR